MLKKMMLLAGMAVAAIAFAAPASAMAQHGTHWTDNHEVIEPSVTREAPFEGFLDFTIAPPNVPVHSTFGCEVTGIIQATGPTNGQITKFAPTTNTCVGTGIFAKCELETHTANVPWTVTNTTADLDVTKPGGDVTINNVYKNCAAGAIPPSDPEFASITVDPTIDPDTTITSLAITGVDTKGAVTATGSIAPEPGTSTLGLVTVE